MAAKKPPFEDEHDLFERAMHNVEPIAKRAEPSREFSTAPPEAAVEKAKKLHSSRPAPPRVSAPAAASNPGIDKRQAERFKRGRMEIDGRIDLHGMKQREAHDRLHGFIHRGYDRGWRCVLVITGKGSRRRHSEDADFMPDRDTGVLRRNVPRWLQEPGLADKVLSVSEAQIRHGGGGALYVLLRRKRP